MCGIVAAAAGSNIVSVLIEGLKKLEYRGYDSAGLALLAAGGIERVRAVGRVADVPVAGARTGRGDVIAEAGPFGEVTEDDLRHR